MLEFLVYLKLFGGFVYLLLGGDLLVRGSLGLARQSAIPPMIIGLTVVAMGTSAPELMVSSYSALSGHPDISIGNVVGSNIANVLLVLGVPAIIYPVWFVQKGLRLQTSILLAVTILFIVLCINGPLGLFEGILMLALMVAFLFLTIKGSSIVPGLEEDVEEEMERVIGVPAISWKIMLYISLGIAILPMGANLVVEGAAGIARNWGVSEAVIGLSLIALGTSLPELGTTVVAAMHKSSDVTLGNIIGSNLFNILGIMGVTSILAEVPVMDSLLNWDIWIMLGCTLILVIGAFMKLRISRIVGVVMITAYVLYMVSLFQG